MLFDKTKSIDILKLEQESQKLFLLGFVIGIVCIAALDPLLLSGRKTYILSVRTEKTESRKPIPIEFIVIRSRTEPIAPPAPEPEEKESPAIERLQKTEVPPEIVEKTETETDTISFLQHPILLRKFPDLTGQSNIPQEQISVPETIRIPESMKMFQKPKPEPTVTIPVEEVKDKRREFKTDFFGIHLDGIPSIPIHLARNAPNFIKWKIRDIFKKRQIKIMDDSNFAAISAKEVRFMILVWRDGLLDTHKLSKSDREFIHSAQTSDSEIMTHETYLIGMEKRGLVTSLIFEDNLVFRANFSRDEFLETFVFERINSAEPDSIILLNTFIKLILASGDSTKTEITIPIPRNITF
ncbi:hypothetical protein ACFL6H_00505 [Candidatus Latescibacterota bacterium]